MDKLYGKYFQKSLSFLFPLLGIKKSSPFTPVGSFLSLTGIVEPEDMVLVVVYNKDESERFRAFETMMLLDNPMFQEKYQTNDKYIYLFNYSMHQNDWFNFLMGKYSKLSTQLKRSIKLYYGETSVQYQYMDSYLYPQKYFDKYAELLGIEVKILKKLGELCDSWDVEKETLTIPVEQFLILDKLP